jgi:Ala-tRNA(Pro) deacylase
MPSQPVLELLQALAIPYSLRFHPPVYTVEQARQYDADLPGAHCKNLFLRNKKGDRYFLAVFSADTPIDLDLLAARVGETRLSLASRERLQRVLLVEPGSVGPLALIQPAARGVLVILDSNLRACGHAGFHPNVNTATLTMAWPDFERFLAHLENPIIWI